MSATKILELLLANLPILIAILGGLGALGFLAAKIRRAVVKARQAAAKTPTKIDDVLVDMVDGPIMQIANMIEAGDLPGAKAKIVQVQTLIGKAKAGKPLDLKPLPKMKVDPR